MPDMLNDRVLDGVHLAWCVDILKRIKQVVESDEPNDIKCQQISWLVKQALKVERED
jgi:hypothetical protein